MRSTRRMYARTCAYERRVSSRAHSAQYRKLRDQRSGEGGRKKGRVGGKVGRCRGENIAPTCDRVLGCVSDARCRGAHDRFPGVPMSGRKDRARPSLHSLVLSANSASNFSVALRRTLSKCPFEITFSFLLFLHFSRLSRISLSKLKCSSRLILLSALTILRT